MIRVFDRNNIRQCYSCKKPILENKITIFNNKIYHKYCFREMYINRINKLNELDKRDKIYNNKISKNKTILSHKMLNT